MDGRIPSLPMRGEWIEISYFRRADLARSCLSPCGESGLKWHSMATAAAEAGSLPMRGEWIEIAPPDGHRHTHGRSLPMRGEWIEMKGVSLCQISRTVSPHAGRVD